MSVPFPAARSNADWPHGLHLRQSGSGGSNEGGGFFVQGRRGWVRLHKKGGKEHEMPTHHNLDRYLEEYIRAANIAGDRKSPLFRTTRGRSGELTANSLLQSHVWRMIRRASTRRRYENRDWLPHLPSDGHYGLSEERRQVGDCSANGGS